MNKRKIVSMFLCSALMFLSVIELSSCKNTQIPNDPDNGKEELSVLSTPSLEYDNTTMTLQWTSDEKGGDFELWNVTENYKKILTETSFYFEPVEVDVSFQVRQLGIDGVSIDSDWSNTVNVLTIPEPDPEPDPDPVPPEIQYSSEFDLKYGIVATDLTTLSPDDAMANLDYLDERHIGVHFRFRGEIAFLIDPSKTDPSIDLNNISEEDKKRVFIVTVIGIPTVFSSTDYRWVFIEIGEDAYFTYDQVDEIREKYKNKGMATVEGVFTEEKFVFSGREYLKFVDCSVSFVG